MPHGPISGSQQLTQQTKEKNEKSLELSSQQVPFPVNIAGGTCATGS